MATVSSGVPAIDYTSKDYSGFLNSMLAYAKTAFPEWTNQNPGSLEVMILESLSRELDVLSYYGDRIVGEAYIGTATQLSSVIQLAQLLGYTPGQPLAATGTVTFQTAFGGPAVSIPAATQVTTDYITSLNGPIIFETTSAVTVPANGGTVTANVVQGSTQGSAVFTLGNNTTAPYQLTTELLGTSTGAPLQTFNLANNPVVSGSVTIYVQNPNYPGTSGTDPIVPWVQFNSLQSAKSSDLAWSYTTDANGVVTIHFGDNVNGSIPPAGLNIYANYRVGGGTVGNLTANSIIDIASPITGVSISGSSATSGGTNAEGIDQIRVNAPKAFTTQQRAVTLADYANLAMSLSYVSNANAVATTYTNITIYMTTTGNTTPTQTILDQVASYVQQYALAGTTVSTAAATLVGVGMGTSTNPIIIGCSSRYSPTSIQTAATQALQALFTPDKVTIGGRVTLSSAYAALYAIPGVQYVNIPYFARIDSSFTGAADILFRSFEVPFASGINITVNAS